MEEGLTLKPLSILLGSDTHIPINELMGLILSAQVGPRLHCLLILLKLFRPGPPWLPSPLA